MNNKYSLPIVCAVVGLIAGGFAVRLYDQKRPKVEEKIVYKDRIVEKPVYINQSQNQTATTTQPTIGKIINRDPKNPNLKTYINEKYGFAVDYDEKNWSFKGDWPPQYPVPADNIFSVSFFLVDKNQLRSQPKFLIRIYQCKKDDCTDLINKDANNSLYLDVLRQFPTGLNNGEIKFLKPDAATTYGVGISSKQLFELVYYDDLWNDFPESGLELINGFRFLK